MPSPIWIIGEAPNSDPQSLEEAFPANCLSRISANKYGFTDAIFEGAVRRNIAPTLNDRGFDARRRKAGEYWRAAKESDVELIIVFGRDARMAFNSALRMSHACDTFRDVEIMKSKNRIRIWFLGHPSQSWGKSQINEEKYAEAAHYAIKIMQNRQIIK